MIETLCETVNESRKSFFIYQMKEVRIIKKEREKDKDRQKWRKKGGKGIKK